MIIWGGLIYHVWDVEAKSKHCKVKPTLSEKESRFTLPTAKNPYHISQDCPWWLERGIWPVLGDSPWFCQGMDWMANETQKHFHNFRTWVSWPVCCSKAVSTIFIQFSGQRKCQKTENSTLIVGTFSTGEDLSEGFFWPNMLSFELDLAALVQTDLEPG